MALGTPVAAAAAYSAASGTTVSPAYPAGILATDEVVLFVGMKPTAVGGGTVTTPTGWTLQDSLTNAGGYTVQGADSGNTNLYVYTWNTPVAGQTGNLTVTIGGNNVTWAFMVRVPTGGGTPSFGSADGQRTTTPTSPMSIALTNGATATNFQAGDLALWAMCIPTDVTTPAQFSAQSITATGATFATAVELNEPDSTTGNDIGGYSAYASVTAGSSTTAPTVTVTLAGTLTNVRGPVVLLRLREGAAPQTLTPSLYTNTNTFHNPTVTPGAVALTPALYTNDQTFYSADVTQTGGAQSLQPSLYTNNNTFYTQTATSVVTLTPARYDNANIFYAPTVNRGAVTLTAARYDNSNTFYSATVTRGTVTLSPARYENTNVFYSPVVTDVGRIIAPPLLENTQTFYSATVNSVRALTPTLFNNSNTFYSPSANGLNSVIAPLLTNSNTFYPAELLIDQALVPALFVNTNTFFESAIQTGPVTLICEDYVVAGYVTPGYVEFSAFNANQFFVAEVSDATIILLTGVQALGLVGYANVWGLVPNTQDADWGEISDGQNPNWQPVVNGLTPVWGTLPTVPNANWQTMTTT